MFKEDLSAFFSDFAEDASVEKTAGVTVTVKVIFDENDQVSQMFDTAVEGQTPSILTTTEDADKIGTNGNIRIRGKLYRAKRPEAQGDGKLSKIWLTR